MSDRLRSWLVCLIPRSVCLWLWESKLPLYGWTPHIFGRMIGVDGKKADE